MSIPVAYQNNQAVVDQNLQKFKTEVDKVRHLCISACAESSTRSMLSEIVCDFLEIAQRTARGPELDGALWIVQMIEKFNNKIPKADAAAKDAAKDGAKKGS